MSAQCNACTTGVFACSECNTRYCGVACWERSQCIGTQVELMEEFEHRTRLSGGRPFHRIIGPKQFATFHYKNRDILLFGEIHLPLLQLGQMDIVFDAEQLTFTGTNGDMISITRLLYAIAAASKRQGRQTDIFYEQAYFDVSRAIPDLQSGLSHVHEVARHMKCVTKSRERQSSCDVHPLCRFHLADYREDTNNDFMDLFAWFLENAWSLDVVPEFVASVRDFISHIGLDWEWHLFTLSLESDNFAHDMASWISPHVLRLKVKSLPDDNRTNRLVTNLQRRIAGWATEKNITLKIRKQWLRLKDVDAAAADMIMQYYKAHQYELFHTCDWLVTNEDLDEMELSHVDFVEAQQVYMDFPVLCRMFRFDAKLSIVYAGDAHIHQYIDVFVWWCQKTRGGGPQIRLRDGGEKKNKAQDILLGPKSAAYLNSLVQ